MVGYLRRNMGYDGLVMTDDMEMGQGTPPNASRVGSLKSTLLASLSPLIAETAWYKARNDDYVVRLGEESLVQS